MKTLKIKEETHWVLSKVKANLKFKTYDDLIATAVGSLGIVKGLIENEKTKNKNNKNK